MPPRHTVFRILTVLLSAAAPAAETVHDIVVYGDSSGAVTAAISANR